MKVLVISHNVMSRSDNMGKTLMSYFADFTPHETAQFYIHCEMPTDRKICRDYYRFTDIDALKSLLPFKTYGKRLGEADILEENCVSREDVGGFSGVYQFGRGRSGFIYIARNLLWGLSRWFDSDLKRWLEEVSPDIVFFAAGDYAFMYDAAVKIADYVKCPLVLSCVDDYYIYNKNKGSFLGRLAHAQLMKSAKKAFKRASFATAICEKMAIEYGKLFKVKFVTLYTGAEKTEDACGAGGRQISYIGNIGYSRHIPLIEMGKALKSLKRTQEPLYIDVYTAESDGEVLSQLTPENGIRFHGRISSREVKEVMARSMAVIHTEAFDEDTENIVRFSVSTKIAESLLSGPCLIAYGAKGIASFDYLSENGAAFVINSKDGLQGGLKAVIENEALRKEIVSNARALAEKNHRTDVNAKKVRGWLEQCVVEERAKNG